MNNSVYFIRKLDTGRWSLDTHNQETDDMSQARIFRSHKKADKARKEIHGDVRLDHVDPLTKNYWNSEAHLWEVVEVKLVIE